MVARVIIGSVLGAAVMFGWGYVFWEKLPFGHQFGPQGLEKEEAVLDALKQNVDSSGVYFVPMVPANANEPALQEYVKKLQDGPVAKVVYRKNGVGPIPLTFVLAGIHFLVSALLAGGLLAAAAPALTTFASRFLFILFLGIFAAVFVRFSDAIWFHSPWDYQLFLAGYDVSSWLLAGVIMALVIRAPRAAAVPKVRDIAA